METNSTPTAVTPPKLILSIRAGFDAITTHIGLILFPLALDLLLWLGPRLKMQGVLQSFIKDVTSQPSLNTTDMLQLVQVTREIWATLAERLNILATLRTFPIGVPSLMFSTMPIENPFGNAITHELESPSTILSWWLLLVLFGLLLGALYWSLVARATIAVPQPLDFGRVGWATLQTLGLSIGLLVALSALLIPMMLLISFMALLSPAIAQFILLLGLFVVLWVAIPLFFSPHGIFALGQNAFAAAFTSLQVVRFNMGGASLFFITAVILSQGMDTLWRMPGESSWLSLVGILGHAFISTALLASSFIYYRSGLEWAREVLTRAAQTGPKPPQV